MKKDNRDYEFSLREFDDALIDINQITAVDRKSIDEFQDRCMSVAYAMCNIREIQEDKFKDEDCEVSDYFKYHSKLED